MNQNLPVPEKRDSGHRADDRSWCNRDRTEEVCVKLAHGLPVAGDRRVARRVWLRRATAGEERHALEDYRATRDGDYLLLLLLARILRCEQGWSFELAALEDASVADLRRLEVAYRRASGYPEATGAFSFSVPAIGEAAGGRCDAAAAQPAGGVALCELVARRHGRSAHGGDEADPSDALRTHREPSGAARSFERESTLRTSRSARSVAGSSIAARCAAADAAVVSHAPAHPGAPLVSPSTVSPSRTRPASHLGFSSRAPSSASPRSVAPLARTGGPASARAGDASTQSEGRERLEEWRERAVRGARESSRRAF